MNISLNLTLLIQIINFLATYFFISKFFLKPALRLFEEDKEKKENLEKQIIEKKNKILYKESIKRIAWEKYQAEYNKIIPNPILKSNKIKFSELNLEITSELNEKELNKFVYDISEILKSKVIQ